MLKTMKMLDISKRVAAISLLLFFLGCGDRFIELIPRSTVSTELLFKTDKDFQDAVIGCYRTLQVQYQNFWVFGDVTADDSEQQLAKSNAQYLIDRFIIETDNTLIRDTWRNYYRLINRANTILDKIADTDPAVVTNKDRHIGEAKFLRALAYFDLVRIFGAVPMVTTEITIEESYRLKREDTDRIYDDVIIGDLLDAESKLPTDYTGANVGRATKGAAKALLGRVYLTKGDFANAERKLEEVTTMGYHLLDNFADVFDHSNEHHGEYIFDVEYEEGLGDQGSRFTHMFLPRSTAMSAHFGIVGTTDENNSPAQGLIDSFEDHDSRKEITVGIPGGFVNASGTFVPFAQTTSQTYTKKYLAPVAVLVDSKINWKVIRYADVLLMYAEALNENGKAGEALSYLNQIRGRAGVDGYAGLSREELRERIALERRLELAFEGHRWFDLVRTGRAYEVMAPFGMRAHMVVFPVPLEQIQIINNPSIFPQNPGYN